MTIIKLSRKTRKFRCYVCGKESELPFDLCIAVEVK